VLDLISAFQILPASRLLRSVSGGKNLFSDLARLNSSVNSDDFDTECIIPLLRAVISNESDELLWEKAYIAVTESTPPPRPISSIQQTPWLRNTSSFANSSEYRKYTDDVLKEELGTMYVGIPEFFEAKFGEVIGLKPTAKVVFEKCKDGDEPIYRKNEGWRKWPHDANEPDVLHWFAGLSSQITTLADEHQFMRKTSRRPLAQPNQPVQGSTAERKLDIGFVDDSTAREDSKCHWSQILVPGELKRNPLADTASKAWLDLGRYAREVLAAQDTRRFVLGFTLCGSLMRLWQFDRLGGIASSQFNIHNEPLQFLSAILAFLRMDKELLGFDPTVVSVKGQRYIEIERGGQTERLIIDEVIRRAPCIVGRATTCWKAHREGDDSRALVIKDSWQYPEREEEGELLREATNKGVVNVARYYHHETVYVGNREDDIKSNVRNGLDIIKATNFKGGDSISSLNMNSVRVARNCQSSTAIRRKRSSSQTNAPMPPNKRSCSSSPTKLENGIRTFNRVHRRVILRDFGKPITKASSQVALLAALEKCIEGYQSLYEKAGMLQCDVSPGNLMINEEDDNSSWPAFLTDLDLAVKEQRDGFSGARGKTGTRAFMAIGVLLGEKHSFMHDLESFFWVLFWICIHYNGPDQGKAVPRFEKWNYANMEELAVLKSGTISDESIFLRITEETFTSYHLPLIPCVNRLRRRVFPNGERWKKPDPNLYSDMMKILRNAREDPLFSSTLGDNKYFSV
jgi:protein kinase-like protein